MLLTGLRRIGGGFNHRAGRLCVTCAGAPPRGMHIRPQSRTFSLTQHLQRKPRDQRSRAALQQQHLAKEACTSESTCTLTYLVEYHPLLCSAAVPQGHHVPRNMAIMGTLALTLILAPSSGEAAQVGSWRCSRDPRSRASTYTSRAASSPSSPSCRQAGRHRSAGETLTRRW